MIQKYRKKPVVIEAVQFDDNLEEIEKFCCGNAGIRNGVLAIMTLEGAMLVSPKDYVIKGVNGEFYPCKPDIFDKTYEGVDLFIGVDLAGGPDYTGWPRPYTR